MNTLKKIAHAIVGLCMFVIFWGFFVPNIVNAASLYDYEDDYSEYVYVYCESPTMTLTVGQTQKIDIEIIDNFDTNNELVWESSDPSIASVDGNGVVKAKRAGKATITVYYGADKDKCVVTVKKKTPTYKQAATKLKKIAKKNKNFIFKTIDAGKVCRLYAKMGVKDVESKDKFKTEGYFMSCHFFECIELRKKGSGSIAKLKMFGLIQIFDYFNSVSLTASQLKLKTSNRRLSFDFNEIKSKSYYTDGIDGGYHAYSHAQAVVASTSDKDKKDLKKFNKMLGQKSLTLKFQCYNGAYYQMGVGSETRKNWKSLNKTFIKFMELY